MHTQSVYLLQGLLFDVQGNATHSALGRPTSDGRCALEALEHELLERLARLSLEPHRIEALDHLVEAIDAFILIPSDL